MIKGILFDKDGTLIEFDSLWVGSTYAMIDSIVKEYARDNLVEKMQEIARLVGLDGNRVKEDALVAAYTAEDLAMVIANALQVEVNEIHEKINAFFMKKL